ncbi:hypothetical protein ACFQMA_07955 [Halosimplex aquaticum]|uniref:PIN domain-containing protein n=1 Tax=Halosimplex aquaticum TaxID=3026162 RepID=A0ABD5XXF0_9EURY|nr:hypothetical protein [Halosimplex aquaticum]
MLILDSNVWIYIATAAELPVEIYSDTLGERLYFTEEFYDSRHQTVVSAYMVEEIQQGLHRSERVESEEIDEALTLLFKLFGSCDDVITTFDGDELEDLQLRDVRQKPHNQLLGHLLDIQAKDVPIFSLAYEYRYERPHILTDDGGFGELSPAAFGLQNITVEELSLTW